MTTDIFAMAMTLAHLLTGGQICRPFPTGADLVQTSADGEWPRLENLEANVPPRLRKVIEAGTRYDVARRPQTVDDFKRHLDRSTPAVSFLPPGGGGTLVSSDGAWSISLGENAGDYSVEVRRGGRRRNALGVNAVSAGKARGHVRTLVGRFATGAV